MTHSSVDVRAVVISFISYLVASVAIFGVVMSLWIAESGLTDPEALRLAAESDAGLLAWQNAIGSTGGVLAGALLAVLNRRQLWPTIWVLGAVLVVYGVIGIVLHPTHPESMQLGKLIAPLPLVCLGAYLARRAGIGAKVNAPVAG